MSASAQETSTKKEEVKADEAFLAFTKAFKVALDQLRMSQEPTQELQHVVQVISEAAKSNRMGTDELFAQFIYDHALSLLHKCAKEITKDPIYLEVVGNVLEAFIELFIVELKHKRYNQSFVCAMTWAFQPDCNLHNRHFLLSEEELCRIITTPQVWRKDLAAGMQVDVQLYADTKKKMMGWLQGTISEVNQDCLTVVFPDSIPDYNMRIDRWDINLAPFEEKTKENYAWRKANLTGAVDYVCDMHDMDQWWEGTIFKTEFREVEANRRIEVAYCAFRVYRNWGDKMKKDERGEFDGWSKKYDEWIPIYSPRIMPHLTKKGNNRNDNQEVDEDLDNMVEPEEGYDRIIGVPRFSTCISHKFIHFMNKFGNEGGYQAILDIIEKAEPNESLSMTTIGYLITMLSMPIKLFHKDFIEELGSRFSEGMKQKMLTCSDQHFKSISMGDVEQIQTSINQLNSRIVTREQMKIKEQILKLEIVKRCLASEYLERRILGIKTLNKMIRENTLQQQKALSTDKLIEWMSQKQVFAIIWDYKRTHLQLVQRSNEIFKMLLREDLLSQPLLEMFWSLTKSDYKSEVLKIMNESAYYLKQPQIEYLFGEITQTPANKLSMEDLNALSDLGKYGKDPTFQTKISDFFWKIITESDKYNDELVDNCISKFSEMIRYWSLEKKEPFFNQLSIQMKKTENSAIPILKLFSKLIKDQKARVIYNGSTASSSSKPTTVTEYSKTVSATGNVIYSRSFNNNGNSTQPQESIYNKIEQDGETGTISTTEPQDSTKDAIQQQPDKELTLEDMLNRAWQEQGLVENLLENLKHFIEATRVKISQDQSLLKIDRSELKLIYGKYSHSEEVKERLDFLQEFAANCLYTVSQAQLQVIYDLLSKSPLPSDIQQFYLWCQQACDDKVSQSLDMLQVGQFVSKLIDEKELNVAELPIVGFKFIQSYWTSVNLDAHHIMMVEVDKKQKEEDNSWGGGWYSMGSSSKKEEAVVDDMGESANFVVGENPSQLLQMGLIWQIVLQSRQKEVTTRAINLLVNSHVSLQANLQDSRGQILQELTSQCFKLLQQYKEDEFAVKRVVLVLQSIIQFSEFQGTGGVQPHNALFKGEMLNRIIVKYMVKNKQSFYGGLKLDKSVVVKLYTSATVWEFKQEVSRMLGLAPKYVKFELPDKSELKENQHGMVLQQLNLKNGDIITAQKISVKEQIPEAPIWDRPNNCLTPPARKLFQEWFHTFKNPETNLMGKSNLASFIRSATKQNCSEGDSRVEKIMSQYDSDKDDQLTEADFITFYSTSASGDEDQRGAVRANLKNLNVRPDLKKISEVIEESSFKKTDMPRYTLSANQDQFHALIDLLDRKDSASGDVWNLVRALATNQHMYMEVLGLEKMTNAEGQVNWQQVFEDPSVYKQIYKQEIIVALMEHSKSDSEKRVMFVEEQLIADKFVNNQNQESQSGNTLEQDTANQQLDEKTKEIEQMKLVWTKQFLENGGFQYILKSFLGKSDKMETIVGNQMNLQAQVKDISFLSTLSKVFFTAAFGTLEGNNIIQMVRRSSSLADEGAQASVKEEKELEQLSNLIKGAPSAEILYETDFELVVKKMLEFIANVLAKKEFILEDKLIVENCLTILLGSILYQPELFGHLTSFKGQGSIADAQDLILQGLLKCPEEKIRQDFKMSLGMMCKNLLKSDQNCLNYILGLLGDAFAQSTTNPCRQYFELFNELIDYVSLREALGGETKSDDLSIYDPEKLLAQIIDEIKNNKKKQADQSQNEEEGSDEVKVAEMAAENDRLMVGLINLTGKIIKNAKKEVSERIIEEKDLISQIFKEFLFASYYKAVESGEATGQQTVLKQNNRNKSSKKQVVTNNKSREAAYDLLNQLIQNSGFLMGKFINQQLVPLIKEVKKPKGWNYMPQTNLETSQKYVGLRNLGCICYMNSMMQQFFMIPAFRYNLMCVDDEKSEEIVEYKGEKIDDNMLHQMQRLIAHLELSTRNDYNPLSFCFAFKEFDGNPTNTSEQKDASEFLSILFDRLENALKPTPRKYLLQSIFGGKYCSQMVCKECGKVKNRQEDFYFLSLDVKDIKSVNESLSKQVEGEIISDYQCDGCNRKVDLSKRTLIAETPNILIVHLKRLVFNFDTFQNDKLNSFMKFPTVLDLKPYSYFDVMEKEGRNKKKEEDGEESSSKLQIEELTEEELLKKKEAEDDAREPIQDDCFEYKLVGVNVHSGTANAGHYWSYINTHRGTSPEEEAQQTWLQTEKDPWMEYNDSSVTDWQFKDMESKCFGNEQKQNSYGGYYSMGDSYGTSGYMLFYERRVKKPIKIVVPDTEIEAVKAKGITVKCDEEKKEYFREVQYRKAADGEKPNQIYQKVFEDNRKFSFENDIYSQEFFDFILQVLTNLAALKDSDAIKTKLQGLVIGKKVGFAILARCQGIPGINKIAEVMVDIVKSSPECAKLFLEEILSDGKGIDEDILAVLFETSDSNTQTHLGRVLKFMLCSLKESEKDLIMSEEVETVTVENSQGVKCELPRYKSVALRFLTSMIALLPQSARHWRKFDTYLDLFYSFAIHSADEIAIEIETQKVAPLDKSSEAYKIGSELFFKKKMIMILGDFILGKQSPIYKPEQDRYEMGGSYIQPNFTQLLKLITILMSDEKMVAKYPLSAEETAIVSHKEILQKMIEPAENSDTDFTDLLLGMCKNNRKLSKKMAKAYLKGLSKTQTDISGRTLSAVKRFLQIDDELKPIRIEWIFGQAQLVSKPNYRTRQQNYGLDLIEGLESDYYTYKSECAKQGVEPFLQQIYKLKGRMETLCVQSILVLIEMCLLDGDICKYVVQSAPPTIQYARYTDWFFPYVDQISKALENQTNSASYIKLRKEAVEGIQRLREVFESKMSQFSGNQTASEMIKKGTFEGYNQDCIYGESGEVIDHFPPTYLVGQTTGNSRQLLVEEADHCQVVINEIEAHHMYSNPTGQFNLTTPSKLWRNPSNYTQISYKALKTAQIKSQRAANGESSDAPIDMDMREFQTDARPAYCILAVEIKSKVTRMVRVSIQLSVKDNANKNVNLPVTYLNETLFSSDQKIAHVFCKIDPSKENWGDITLTINDTPSSSSSASQTITTTGTYGGTYGSSTYMGGNIYAGMGQGTTGGQSTQSTTTSTNQYRPIGADEDGTAKVMCAHCDNECFVGEDYCSKCGQSVLGDGTY